MLRVLHVLRVRRTLAGTLTPGDGWAPSLFGDDQPAPLAMLAGDVGRLEAVDTVPSSCPACGGRSCSCSRIGAEALELQGGDDDEPEEAWPIAARSCPWCKRTDVWRPRTGLIGAHRCDRGAR